MRIYHYTSLDIAATHILPAMQLRFSAFENLNDPVESLIYCTNGEDNIFSVYNMDQIARAQKIRKEWRAICFSTDRKINKISVEGDTLQRMWAQYGDKNEGICLAIDVNKFLDENKELSAHHKIWNKKVKYSQNEYRNTPQVLDRAHGESSTLHTDIEGENIRKRFFTKNKDWEGESEYRFLVHTKDSEELYMSIKNSLEYIVLGVGVSKKSLPLVIKFMNGEKSIHNLYGLKVDEFGNLIKEQIPEDLITK
jgi:hypothetical protein